MTDQPPTEPFRILVVCTGNICRSPFAERVLRRALGRVGGELGAPGWATEIVVTSAGTEAMVGHPIETTMAAWARHHDVEGDPHAARQLDRELLADADLVLALARDHRRDIVTLLPRASRTVFTLNEFARLVEDAAAAGILELPDGRNARDAIEAVVDAAAMRRGFAIAPDDPRADDVPDPYRRDAAAYEAAAAQIVDAITRVESAIIASSAGRGR